MIVITLALAVVAAGLWLVVLHRRLRALAGQAITDPLTGVFNRRQFETSLVAAIERHRRMREPASLLVFDVDRFKDINDALGHHAGDRVLKGLAGLAAQRVRKLDSLFRIGGEEFALLLSSARFPDAVRVAEQLRKRVAAARLIEDGPVSISVGVSELSPDQSADEWVKAADAALYSAKRSGRNRVAGTPPMVTTMGLDGTGDVPVAGDGFRWPASYTGERPA